MKSARSAHSSLFRAQAGCVRVFACIAISCVLAPKAPLHGQTGWQTSGNNIYFSTGNVGIGTTTPGSPLVIQSTTVPQLSLNNSSGNARLDINPQAGGVAQIVFDDGGTLKWSLRKDASNNLSIYDLVNITAVRL